MLYTLISLILFLSSVPKVGNEGSSMIEFESESESRVQEWYRGARIKHTSSE